MKNCTWIPFVLVCLVATPVRATSPVSASANVSEDEQVGERPNVIIFLADDLGWTGLRCFGSDFYETPNLDQLAAEGMKFTDAYAACTVCSPTRASVMTGMYPARLRCTDFIAGQNRPYAKLRIPNWTKRLESKYTTIAEALHAAGYRTGHFGKWHLNGRGEFANQTGPLQQGFDVSVEKPTGSKGYFLPQRIRAESGSNYVTDWLTDQACQFIRDSREEPFFLYFAYHVPHTPIQGREDLVEKFRKRREPQAIHNNPVYAAMVASLDDSVGRVRDCLESEGLADNTLVVFTSDNGGLTQRFGKHDGFTENLPLRRGKGSAYEGGVRVPTIVHWPGITPPGSVSSTPIMTTDYYPTVLEVTGVAGDAAHNRHVDGKSLVPTLRDPEQSFDRQLYWHYPHYHAGGDGPYSAVRDRDYRLILFHEDDFVRLYNLADDLGEQHDLSKVMPDRTRALRQNLEDWMKSVNAQRPTSNPNFDPARQSQVAKRAK